MATTETYRFNHPIECVEWLKTQDGRESGGRKSGNSYGWNSDDGADTYNSPYHFNANQTWAGIQELAHNGWHAGTDDIVSKIENIKHSEAMEARGYRWDVTGCQFDVGQVLSGEPECWLEQDYQPTRKTVSICVNIAASAIVDSEKLARRGAAIIALVDRLQDAGYIVELSAVCGTIHNGNKTFSWFDFGMTPLDIDAASLVLAHPGWFRVACFALTDCGNGSWEAHGTSCQEITAAEKDKFNIYIPSGDLRNENGQALHNDDDAAHWVEEMIKKVA